MIHFRYIVLDHSCQWIGRFTIVSVFVYFPGYYQIGLIRFGMITIIADFINCVKQEQKTGTQSNAEAH